MKVPLILWLATIEDKDLREEALLNAEKPINTLYMYLDEDYDLLSDAIINGFRWDNSERGAEFWNSYYTKLIKKGK